MKKVAKKKVKKVAKKTAKKAVNRLKPTAKRPVKPKKKPAKPLVLPPDPVPASYDESETFSESPLAPNQMTVDETVPVESKPMSADKEPGYSEIVIIEDEGFFVAYKGTNGMHQETVLDAENYEDAVFEAASLLGVDESEIDKSN